ncbi:hypothetical protein MLD38_012170 [Melastoma candidum]|uniref:Uncharacterized protein n=1 Tax=Melastoma candidum TaxID=119954 RepID=A0ACB9R785_9MYRT|nr:hypothetical protein MLD38_012170 [Melastoma candidum]
MICRSTSVPGIPPKPKLSLLKQQVLSQLGRCNTLTHLESLYAFMVKKHADQDCFLMNQFISVCSHAGRVRLSVAAFERMRCPNVFVYNAMIRSLVCCGFPRDALRCFGNMLAAGVRPTSYTFSSLMKACGASNDPRSGAGVHGHVRRSGLDSNLFVQTALVDFYGRFHEVGDAKKVFDEMIERDVFAWSTLISSYTRVGDMISARCLFDQMPERNTATWNSLIDGYSRMGEVEMAESLFDSMTERDVISWTTMITCYSQNRRYGGALALFEEMTSLGIMPDEVTLATVLSACAHHGALYAGRKIHRFLLQNQVWIDVYVGSALVDMYAKCGDLSASLLVFYKLLEKNLFCWNSIIEGLAMHSQAKQALVMFGKMEKEKVQPNGVTFISVLSACSHAGLVKEGRIIFQRMMKDYSLDPEVEHYGCMVDLLSKAGLLEEALEMVNSMTTPPNSVIWGTVLTGCKIHKNLDIARIAIDALNVLEPDGGGHQALLVSMYAESNRWVEVAEIRAAMKDARAVESPGHSCIEVDGQIHQFAASDSYHPNSNHIYLLLDNLELQMRRVFYILNLSACDL